MAYLESKKVLHRDLACRNLLVGKNEEVVISDFGLSRSGYDYYISSGTKIPVKWTAVEIFKGQPYTSLSDVWSFGVVCWEVMEAGTQPWTWLSNQEVMETTQSKTAICLTL